jgi:serine/threonine-protein kinase
VAVELIEGRTLGDVVNKEGPLPLAVVTHIADQLAGALTALHERDIVCADPNPLGNAMIDAHHGGRVVLLDPGVRRVVQHMLLTPASALTSTAAVPIGNPAFFAPEQLTAGGQITPQTDVYLLAEVVFTLLADRLPFAAHETLPVLHVKLSGSAPDLRAVRPDVPPAVAALLVEALDPDPGRRPPGVREFAARLHAAQVGATGGDQDARPAPHRTNGGARDGRGATAPLTRHENASKRSCSQ